MANSKDSADVLNVGGRSAGRARSARSRDAGAAPNLDRQLSQGAGTTMTMAATRRGPNTVRRALARRGSWRAEAMGAAAVYAIYELSRGLLAGDPPTAIRHATDIATLERSSTHASRCDPRPPTLRVVTHPILTQGGRTCLP